MSSLYEDIFDDTDLLYGALEEEYDFATKDCEDIEDAELDAILTDDEEEDEILSILGDDVYCDSEDGYC